MTYRAIKIFILLALGVCGLQAEEKKEEVEVTLPLASRSAVPEFSSKRLDLAQCVALALEQNTEIRQAKEEVHRKEGVAVEVRSALLPKVTATGNFDYQAKELNGLLVNSGFISADELNWNAGIRVSQLLFDGGAALSRTRAARMSESQSYWGSNPHIEQYQAQGLGQRQSLERGCRYRMRCHQSQPLHSPLIVNRSLDDAETTKDFLLLFFRKV